MSPDTLLVHGLLPDAVLKLENKLAVDVLACPTCQGRMKLLALVKGPWASGPAVPCGT